MTVQEFCSGNVGAALADLWDEYDSTDGTAENQNPAKVWPVVDADGKLTGETITRNLMTGDIGRYEFVEIDEEGRVILTSWFPASRMAVAVVSPMTAKEMRDEDEDKAIRAGLAD